MTTSNAIITTNAQPAQVKVTTSSIPANFTRYLSDDPTEGLIEVSNEQCFDSAVQTKEILSIGAQLHKARQAYTNWTIEMQLNVTGIEEIHQNSLPIDVVIAIDSSGSMEDNDPNNLRISAAKEFVNKLNSTRGHKSGLIGWDDDVDITSPLTSDHTVTNNNIDSIDSSDDTDLDAGLNGAISLLDANIREQPSSKAIIFLSDGEGEYTPSGSFGSPADEAKSKGYKIFSIMVNIDPESDAEAHLRDMALTSEGLNYSQPSEKNIQAIFDNISQTLVTSTEPKNIDVIQVTQNYITVDNKSFGIKPTSIERSNNNETTIKWENISQYIGNRDNKLSANETFSERFLVGVPSNITNLNVRLPITIEGKSVVRYTDHSGNTHVVNIPPSYININSKICPKQGEPVTPIQEQLKITAYKQGLGLITDTRRLNLSEGLNTVRFQDIAALIDPSSIYLNFTDNCCFVNEQTFRYDLLNEQTLLDKFLGKEISLTIIRDASATNINNYNTSTSSSTSLGNGTFDIVTGKLLGFEEGRFIVSSIEGQIHIFPSNIVSKLTLPSLPSELALKPTLAWKIYNTKETGDKKVQVSYLTTGINWNAVYVAVVNSNNSAIDIYGWITLDNQAGTTFKNATMEFLSRDTNIKQPPIFEQAANSLRGPESQVKATNQQKPLSTSIFQNRFFEYHLYSVNTTTTINDKETKQIHLLNALDIPIDKIYTYNITGPTINTDAIPLAIALSFNNTDNIKEDNAADSTLGTPLPSGIVRVYKEDAANGSDQKMVFLGEDSIDHIPKNENITLQVGNASDIVGQTTLLWELHPSDELSVSSYNVTLRNRGNTSSSNAPIVLINVNNLYGESRILKSSIPFEKKDTSTIQFAVTVPTNSKRSFTYTIQTITPSVS